LRLRVQDVDFSLQEVSVRDGKGEKDRITLFPEVLHTVMRDHLERVRMLHEHDLAAGYGRVYLPHALARKSPMPIGNGVGSMCFRHTGSRKTRDPAPSNAITSMRRRSSGPYTLPSGTPVWGRGRRRIRSATVSQRIC